MDHSDTVYFNMQTFIASFMHGRKIKHEIDEFLGGRMCPDV